jgi:hypothetical protein
MLQMAQLCRDCAPEGRDTATSPKNLIAVLVATSRSDELWRIAADLGQTLG